MGHLLVVLKAVALKKVVMMEVAGTRWLRMAKEEDANVDWLSELGSWMSHFCQVLFHNLNSVVVVEKCPSTMGVWYMHRHS